MDITHEYRGYVVEQTKRGFYARDEATGDDFSAESLCEIDEHIDRIRWDQEQDAEWERERSRAEAAGRRLDATLSAVSDAVGAVK